MGLLTVCSQHYEGLFWLISFYLSLNFLPQFYRLWNPVEMGSQAAVAAVTSRLSVLAESSYVLFFASLLFVGGSLPCGRFYYEAVEGFVGHKLLRLSYEYIYIYLCCLAHVVERGDKWLGGFAARLPFSKRQA